MKKLFLVLLAGISLVSTVSSNQSLNAEVTDSINTSIDNQQAKAELSKTLRDFRVTGVATCMDPNFAFIYDNQNPCFDITFKNSAGEIKTRRYQADITSWGLKFEFDLKCNLIMFVNTDLNFEDSNKELHLGTGIDLGLDAGFAFGKGYNPNVPFTEQEVSPLMLVGLALTYAPFKNAAGGLLILSTRFGLQGLALSIVTSGSLKPLPTV